MGFWSLVGKVILTAANSTIGGTAGLKYITAENRDQVRVSWLECPSDKCRELETKWHDKAIASGKEMPWSERR